MKVSVIIPTLNAALLIKGLLKSLFSQQLKPLEVIVVDTSSGDGTLGIAEALGARTITVAREEFDHGGTRNLAASMATGDTLVFMTQDALPLDDYSLSRLLAPLADGIASASYGRHVARPEANPIERFLRTFNYSDAPIIKSPDNAASLGIKAFFLSNVFSAINKDVFLEAGGFAQSTITNEDMLLASQLLKLGHSIAYVPEAAVAHSHNYSLLELMARYFDIGVFLIENEKELGARAEPEGLKFLKSGVSYLIREGKALWVPWLFTEAGVRFLGMRLGLAHNYLPLKAKKLLSRNKNYWSKKG